MGKIVHGLNQNTSEWLAWRRDKLGGSDISAILGVSKWCTPWQLYMRKLGLIAEQADNAGMANGREKESGVLHVFNVCRGYNCKPSVMVHDEYPWMIASLDGWDDTLSKAVEIKCPGKEDAELAERGFVPEHYWPQLQHQLSVTGMHDMWYYSWYKGYGSAIHVERDNEYIKDMIDKEIDFMRRLKDLDPPPLTEKDYVENHSREWRFSVGAYLIAKQGKEYAEQAYNQARDDLIRLVGDHNCRGYGVQLTKVVRRGSVEYSRIPELENVDLDKYRKNPITSWIVTEQ